MAEAPPRISITICGDGGCGKSSITLRLVRSQWTSEYDPTIEDSYSITRRIDGQTYHLSLTDTAGQEEYRGMWGGSNLHADAFLMVYDITNRDSLDQLEYFNDLVDMEAEMRMDAAMAASTSSRSQGRGKGRNRSASQPGHGFVMPVKIVAGNKCDLQESRQVDAKTGLEWSRKRNCGFMETSARNVVNIEETFALIVRRVTERRRAAAADLASFSERLESGYPASPSIGTSVPVPASASGSRSGRSRAGTGGNSNGNINGGSKSADRARERGLRLAPPPQGIDFDDLNEALGRDRANSLGQLQGSRLGTRRAVTAPLSPLPVEGDGDDDEGEKGSYGDRERDGDRYRDRDRDRGRDKDRQRKGPRGPKGPPGEGNGFWGKLRCW